MNKSWEFSKESEPELEEFLEIIIEKDVYNQKPNEIFKKLFPTITNDHQNNNTKIEEMIIIGDDDLNDKTEIENRELTDLTIMSLTCTEDDDENLLNPNVHDFIKYIQENLEYEDSTLEKTDIIKLSSEYNKFTLDFLFSIILDSLSDQGLYNLNHSLCIYPEINLNNVLKEFCRIVLLPKMVIVEPSQLLQLLMKEIYDNYPQITLTELLVPIFKLQSSSTKWLQSLNNILSDIDKQLFLKEFIYTCSELEEWQLLILQQLINLQTEDSVKRRLITLLEVSAEKFINEKLFLKLLITLIQNLGEGFDGQEEILFNTIEKNKTLLKISAHKALREWITKCNN